MKTVKELITEFKILAEKYDTDLQFYISFEGDEYELCEGWDFIRKFNFYYFLHSKYFKVLRYSYLDKRFKVTRMAKDQLKIEEIN
ncbi:hypothetical protein IGI50_001655 [Enterococcus sp. DIV0170]